MNEEQLQIALSVMDTLTKNNLWKIIESTNTVHFDSPYKPISFAEIKEKTKKGLYNSPYQWEFEMRKTFQAYVADAHCNEIQRLSFLELQKEFEKLVADSHIEDLHLTIELNTIKSDLNNLLESQSSKNLPYRMESTDLNPGSSMFLNIDTTNSDLSIKKLERDIKMLRTSESIIRITHFVRKLQPDAISLGNELRIHFNLLKKENLKQLREYVTELMLKAAKGEIDPFYTK